MSRLGTFTAPFPPGVTSWAKTSSVTPRTCFGLELRSARAACTSTKYELPRGVARDPLQSIDTIVTGESFGISTRPLGVCAETAKAVAKIRSGLLNIHTRNGYLPSIGIHVARA